MYYKLIRINQLIIIMINRINNKIIITLTLHNNGRNTHATTYNSCNVYVVTGLKQSVSSCNSNTTSHNPTKQYI